MTIMHAAAVVANISPSLERESLKPYALLACNAGAYMCLARYQPKWPVYRTFKTITDLACACHACALHRASSMPKLAPLAAEEAVDQRFMKR